MLDSINNLDFIILIAMDPTLAAGIFQNGSDQPDEIL